MCTTRTKILIAKILYFLVTLFLRKTKRQIVRSNIRYEVDLTEGIDLSVFLFGNFQKHITNNKLFSLPKNAIVFDVGANFGIMSLQFAKTASYGHIYAFEPTHYAFKRLLKNLQLNPTIAQRINPIKSFLSDVTRKNPKITAFSSWKVGGKIGGKLHPVHFGATKSTVGVGAITLDDFCRREKITRIDFVKIDTDGHEYEVLKGATNTISKFRPVIIFEVGDYTLKEKNIDFNFFLDYFFRLNYKLYDTKSSKKLTRENYYSVVPHLSTTDLIAIPNRD